MFAYRASNPQFFTQTELTRDDYFFFDDRHDVDVAIHVRFDHLRYNPVDRHTIHFDLLMTQIDRALVEKLLDLLTNLNVTKFNDTLLDIELFFNQRNGQVLFAIAQTTHDISHRLRGTRYIMPGQIQIHCVAVDSVDHVAVDAEKLFDTWTGIRL